MFGAKAEQRFACEVSDRRFSQVRDMMDCQNCDSLGALLTISGSHMKASQSYVCLLGRLLQGQGDSLEMVSSFWLEVYHRYFAQLKTSSCWVILQVIMGVT